MAAGAIHLATGFAAGSHARSVPGGFLAGFASHAVFDAIPHHDYQTVESFGVDLSAGALLLGLMSWRRRRNGPIGPALAGAVGAAVPDVENVLWFLGLIPKEARVYPSHGGPIHQRDASFRRTAVYYALAVAGAWLLTSRRPG